LNLGRGKDPGFEIQYLEKKSFWIPDPDPWGKKAPDPGSATLATIGKDSYMILSSIAEPEPHHFGGAVARAITRCGSGSNNSG
jgi:hypothetical protein